MKRFLPLRPVLSQTEEELLKNKKLIFSLVKAFGSPLNLVFPEEVKKNYDSFNSLFDSLEIDGEILYAQKANKSIALLRELIFNGSGTNNASLPEVQHALANGCSAKIVEAGGPKTQEYIQFGVHSNVLMNIDSLSELEQVISSAQQQNKKVRIILRLSGFMTEGVQVMSKPTRFGINIKDVETALDLVAKLSDYLDFQGFSYHLDTIAISEKRIALDCLVKAVLSAQKRGLKVRMVDIGGGYKANYLEDRTQWDTYMTTLRESLLEKQPPVTWRGTGFGLRVHCGVIQGNLNMYNYYDDTVGPDYLHELLKQESQIAEMSFIDFFKETRIQLVLEPGRALLIGAGTTLATVEEVREDSSGNVFVRLDMNRADITIQDLELFLDPVLVKKDETSDTEQLEDGCYLIGNLCLETDFISRRKVYLPEKPQVGDVLAFVNSAAYFSDFNSHYAAMQRIAEKVAVFKDDNNNFFWTRDKEYWPQVKNKTNNQ